MKVQTAAEIIDRHISDQALWADFKKGDKEAFALLYYRYFKVLIQNCLCITTDKDLVKDGIHDLFMELWKNKERLGFPESVKAYLIRSIHRKIIREIKKRRSYSRRAVLIFPSHSGMADSVERHMITEQLRLEQKNDLNRAMQMLTKRQREALYLKFYANLSYPEIAGIMAISTGSIYNLISKAIDSMQHALCKAPLHTF